VSLVLIAALTWPDRVIGKDNAIPWKLGPDLKRFKELTLGHPVVMGRKTWESLPFKLPGRTNVLLTRNIMNTFTRKDAAPDRSADSLDKALALAAQAPGGETVFVIGGAAVYAEALPKADRLALTLVQHPFDGDVWFPSFDPKDWTETFREGHRSEGRPSFAYEFLDLERSRPQGAA
jgi:dihydrofolate reductase